MKIAAIRTAVEQSNNRLNAMDDGLENVRLIIAVLNLRKGIDDLSKVVKGYGRIKIWDLKKKP